MALAALCLVLVACSSSKTGVGDASGGGGAGGSQSGGTSGSGGLASGNGEPASSFRCGNWADQRDNFVLGYLQLSGFTSADTYDSVFTKSEAILADFRTTIGANAIRVPINEPTVLNPWWDIYRGTIDAAIASGMKVIVAYWAWHNGMMDDAARFDAMWDQAVQTYAASDHVYFEIFNEPWGYTNPGDFIDLEVQWLARHSNVPRSRVIIAGSYSDNDVRLQGADSRLDGTLLSLHIYPYSEATLTSVPAWQAALTYDLGSYADRTIVTEWGAPMTTGTDYGGTGEGDHEASFVNGISSYLHDNGIGNCYWPLLRTDDAWSLTTLAGTDAEPSLSINNASGLARIESAFGL